MTTGQIAEVISYCALVIFWGVVCFFSIAHFALTSSAQIPREFRRIQAFFVVVSAILLVDSAYWAIPNIAHTGLIIKVAEDILRAPWLVAGEKALVLVAGIVFLSTVLYSVPKISKGFEQTHYSKFAEHTYDAIGILDRDGKMKVWNNGAEKLFGWGRDEVLGRHIKDFMVPQELHDEIDGALRDIKSTKQAKRNMRTTRLTSDGSRIPIDVTISPIFDEKAFHGYFGIMRRALPTTIAEFKKFQNLNANPHPFGEKPFVFVAMPFSPDLPSSDAWTQAIEGAITAHRLKAVRADYGSAPVRLDDYISNCILNAALVVADLTGANPNVYYELGLARGQDKTVIQLIEGEIDLPFDVAGIRTIGYDRAKLGELKEKLIDAIAEVLKGSPPTRPVRLPRLRSIPGSRTA